MDSLEITDARGRHLRVKYFPYHLQRHAPVAMHNQYLTHQEHLLGATADHNLTDENGSMRKVASAPHIIPKKYPTSYMILDYRQDKKHLMNQTTIEMTNDANSTIPSINLPVQTVNSNSGKSAGNSPMASLKRLKHRAQPLRSSFILKKPMRKDEDLDISEILFNKCDAQTQTEDRLERQEFPNLTEYQNWANNVAEPFLKVIKIIIILNLYFL
jgi:hypothetical protein